MAAIGDAFLLGDCSPGSAPPPKPASRIFLNQGSLEGLLVKTSPTHPCPFRPDDFFMGNDGFREFGLSGDLPPGSASLPRLVGRDLLVRKSSKQS